MHDLESPHRHLRCILLHLSPGKTLWPFWLPQAHPKGRGLNPSAPWSSTATLPRPPTVGVPVTAQGETRPCVRVHRGRGKRPPPPSDYPWQAGSCLPRLTLLLPVHSHCSSQEPALGLQESPAQPVQFPGTLSGPQNPQTEWGLGICISNRFTLDLAKARRARTAHRGAPLWASFMMTPS